MDEFINYSREIVVNDPYDIIVIGGGPAGCTAAAASAGEGARTLLLETTGALGGMGTSGLVPFFCRFSDMKRTIIGGLALEVLKRLRKAMPHVPDDRLESIPIAHEKLKIIFDDIVTGSGADILFNSICVDVLSDGPYIENIVVGNKGGLTSYKSNIYIDCTGDADVAAWAGASFQKGDKEGRLQPANHNFIICNVKEDRLGIELVSYPGAENFDKRMLKIVGDKEFPEIVDSHICLAKIGPGVFGFNAGHIWEVDSTDPPSVSRALIKGRKIADALHRGLKKYLPEVFGDSFLVSTGALLGIRESRRIIGDYILGIDDYVARRSFKDEIFRTSYPVDVHHKKEDANNSNKYFIEGDKSRPVGLEKYPKYEPGESFGIPYRCLTPKGLKNVLVAGRSISTDRLVNGSIRIMPNCMAMGQAAGLAAALTLSEPKPDVHDVDVEKIRDRLKAEGAYLE